MNEMKIWFEDIKEIITYQDRNNLSFDGDWELDGKERLLIDEIRINDTGDVEVYFFIQERSYNKYGKNVAGGAFPGAIKIAREQYKTLNWKSLEKLLHNVVFKEEATETTETID